MVFHRFKNVVTKVLGYICGEDQFAISIVNLTKPEHI